MQQEMRCADADLDLSDVSSSCSSLIHSINRQLDEAFEDESASLSAPVNTDITISRAGECMIPVCT
jgi:hypothetical protein